MLIRRYCANKQTMKFKMIIFMPQLTAIFLKGYLSAHFQTMLKGLFNLLNVLHHVAIIKICLDVGTTIPGRTSAFGGMWKFLTFW